MIVLVFDAHKLDTSDESKNTIEAIKKRTEKTLLVPNNAGMISSQQLMRVYGALMWSLGGHADAGVPARFHRQLL